MPLASAALTVALASFAPATAPAPAVAPAFRDHVSRSPAARRLRAHAAQAAQTIGVRTKEGYVVRVSFTAAAGVQIPLAQAYVGFLDALPHGPELARLRMLIAQPSEVGTLCGGGEDVLACYGADDSQMIVPSTGLDATTADGSYSTAYELTHEYGHHIAANRSDAPFDALDYGPKYWSSYELVCGRTIDRKLAPGNETTNYLQNPGEAWAETYARLAYPGQPWTFTSLLRPDAGALAAARRDVLDPWTGPRVRTFRMPASRTAERFRVALHLDGALKAKVTGRAGSRVGVAVSSGAQSVGSSRAAGSTGTWSLRYGCRDRAQETLSFRVRRSAGRGPVTLRVTYPG
jgi:hypothetical protein